MTRKYSRLALVLLALSLLFTACPHEFDLQVTEAHGDFYGTVFGTAQGWSSLIRVDLTFERGIIVDAYVRSVPGTGTETAIYARALGMAGPIIVATNSVELDRLAGATVTTRAIVDAGREALAKVPAPGTIPPVRYPGTVTRQTLASPAPWGGPFIVTVTLGRTSITGITVENSNESPAVGQSAIPILIERMLRYQTSEVDRVVGATITSTALQSTVANILNDRGAPFFMMESVPTPDRVNSPRRTVDVLVIGSGAAGLSAAIEAASHFNILRPFDPPPSVTLIEKEDMIGGSSRLSSGIVYAPSSEEDAGITGTLNTRLRNYFLFRAQNNADTDLIDAFAEESWNLVNTPWAALPPLSQAFPAGMASQARARAVPGGGLGLVRTLENRARELGITIMTGVEAYELRTHEGAVVQVRARSRTTNFTFDVRRGIVIATGGFDNDRSAGGLLAANNPDSQHIVSLSSIGNTGDGIRMARSIGADTVFRGGRIGSAVVRLPTLNVIIPHGRDILAMTGIGPQWLDIPVRGQFVDTDFSPYDEGGRYQTDDFSLIFSALLQQGQGITFYQFSDTLFPPSGFITHSYMAGFQQAFTFNSITDMGNILFGFYFNEIEEAFTARLTERGFGPPFRLWRIEPASLGSMGGLRIDTQARVLGSGEHGTTNGEWIPGLFAAGEAANGQFFYRQNPAPGSSLGIALTFGRIAGRNAAQSGPHAFLP